MRNTNGLIALLLGLTVAAGMTTSAYAAEISWSNASGGNWSTGSNWTGGIVPGAGDTAFITLDGTYTVTLDADTTVAGITLGGSSGRQTFSMTSRTLTVNGPFTINTNGKASVNYSTINGTGNILVSDTLTLYNSTIDVPLHNASVITVAYAYNYFNRSYTNDSGSTLRLWYPSNLSSWLVVDSGFTNNGLLEYVCTYSTASISVNTPNGPLVNSLTGTISITGTTGSANINAELDNQGTMSLEWPLSLTVASANHTNSGTISLTGGSLHINQSGTTPSFTNTGTIVVNSGYTLDINAGTFDYPSGSITGEGTLDFYQATVTWVPKLNWDGSLILNSSTLTISDSLLIQSRTPVNYSTINGTGNILVSDTMTLITSTINVPLHNAGVITAAFGYNYFNQGYTNDPGSTLRLWYPSNTSSWLHVDSGFTNNGLLELVSTYGSASVSVNTPNGHLVNSPTGTISVTGTAGSASINAKLDNQGTMDIEYRLSMSAASADHTNSGTINITSDNLLIYQSGTTPSFTNTGTIIIDNGRQLWVDRGTFDNQTGGTLAGYGSIYFTASVVSFTNAGIINPGTSPGTLTITGKDLVQQPTCLINIEIAGTTSGDFDSLAIAGSVTKAGILNVDLYNGYFPAIGDSIPFLSASAVSGDFDSLDLAIGGVIFDTVSSATSVSLVCTQADNFDPTISLAATQSYGTADSVQIDLWGASSDPEYPDSLLTFGYTADNDSLLVTIDTAAGTMTLKSDLAYSGTIELIVTVSDPGSASSSDTVTVTIDPYVSVDDETEATLPNQFTLEQNYPNPFNPVTTIEYSVPSRSNVTIEIFDILGRKIKTLVDESRAAGEYQITWDGNNTNGQKVSTGIYFYRFQANDHVATRKMILLK